MCSTVAHRIPTAGSPKSPDSPLAWATARGWLEAARRTSEGPSRDLIAAVQEASLKRRYRAASMISVARPSAQIPATRTRPSTAGWCFQARFLCRRRRSEPGAIELFKPAATRVAGPPPAVPDGEACPRFMCRDIGILTRTLRQVMAKGAPKKIATSPRLHRLRSSVGDPRAIRAPCPRWCKGRRSPRRRSRCTK